MSDKIIEIVWMLGCVAALFIFAFKQEPYYLAAASSLLIVKQLGRINTTLKKDRNER